MKIEHQSRYSQNMPLRCLLYFVDQIKDMLKQYDLFSRRSIRIPTPHFVVFYNGTDCPAEEVLCIFKREIMKKSSE